MTEDTVHPKYSRANCRQMLTLRSRKRFRLLSRPPAVDDDVWSASCRAFNLIALPIATAPATDCRQDSKANASRDDNKCACLDPSHERMLPHPVVKDLLTRIRESVSATAPDPPQLNCELRAEQATQRPPQRRTFGIPEVMRLQPFSQM